MHDKEGEIIKDRKNLIFKRLGQYLKKQSRVPINQVMYNAGALGFRNTDTVIINEVLKLTDDIYEEYPQHVSEQLAFSVLFSSQEQSLDIANSEIYHYWNFKEFRMVLKQFFNKYNSSIEILLNMDKIDPMVLHQPKLKYDSLGFVQKNLRKLRGKWKMPKYNL